MQPSTQMIAALFSGSAAPLRHSSGVYPKAVVSSSARLLQPVQTAAVMAAVFVVVGLGWVRPVGCMAARVMVLMVWVDAGEWHRSPDKRRVV